MRIAHSEVGWLTCSSEAGTSSTHGASQSAVPPVLGFSLGFDFCAEHEHGTKFIKQALGIAETTHPRGVPGRTMTQMPPCLGFVTYTWRSNDRRFKKGMPAALLYCSDDPRYATKLPTTAQELVRFFGVTFYADALKDPKRYKPEQHDIVSAWSNQGGFAVHVRGEENVRRLTELRAAFERHDVSVADAAVMGFRRKAPSLIINSRLPSEVVSQVLADDEAHLRLHEAVSQSGIEQELQAAGKRWYALSPRWSQEEGSELHFYLSPQDQRRYDSGWYTLAELREWAQEQGPIVQSRAISEQVKAQDPDWSIHLLHGLRVHGLVLRRHVKFVWLDKAAGQVGVKLDLAPHKDAQPAGLTPQAQALMALPLLLPLQAVLPFVEEGRELSQAPKDERERAAA